MTCKPSIRMTNFEFCVVMVLCGVFLLLLLPSCTQFSANKRKAQCVVQLKQIGLMLQAYASEHQGVYPPIQRRIGAGCSKKNTSVFMMDGPSMYPEYLNDPALLLCPDDTTGKRDFERGAWEGASGEFDPCLLGNLSYVYMGWSMPPESIMPGTPESFFSAYCKTLSGIMRNGAIEDLDADFTVDLEDGKSFTVRRLGDGASSYKQSERSSQVGNGGDIRAQIPVMFDNFGIVPPGTNSTIIMFNHLPGGSNVLYLDGHVEFAQFPTEFPCSREWGEAASVLGLHNFPSLP